MYQQYSSPATMSYTTMQRPRPSLKWRSRPCTPSTRNIISSMMVILLTVVSTSAEIIEFDSQISESAFYQELAARGQIEFDHREPPLRPDTYLERRQAGDSVVPTTVAATSTSSPSSSSSEFTMTSGASIVSTGTQTTSTEGVSLSTAPSVTVITTPLPTPFDTSLGSNFTTSSCPSFFSTFLGNATFQSCIPVSLLLQNSNSFFRAQRSFTLLTQTLDAACNAPMAICSRLMTSLASELISNANCGADYRQQNPLVMQAYAGLTAYEPVFRATCLKDESTSSYCFGEAITNSSNPADFYPYYIAVGLSLPGTARPTCSRCLKDTMQIYAGYATTAVQPLAKTYLTCATQVDQSCGSQFANTAVKKPNAAAEEVVPRSSAALLLTTVLALWVGLC